MRVVKSTKIFSFWTLLGRKSPSTKTLIQGAFYNYNNYYNYLHIYVWRHSEASQEKLS